MATTHLHGLITQTREADLKRAIVNVAASQTDSTVVAAVTGYKIRVVAYYMVSGGTATNVTFQSNSTAIAPLVADGANGGIVLPINEAGWFETTVSEALKVTTGAGSTTGIHVLYVEV